MSFKDYFFQILTDSLRKLKIESDVWLTINNILHTCNTKYIINMKKHIKHMHRIKF